MYAFIESCRVKELPNNLCFEIVKDIEALKELLYPVFMPHIMENNMLLGMVEAWLNNHTQDKPEIHCAIISKNREIVGAIAQTIPQRPVFSRMSAEVAIFALESWLEKFEPPITLYGPETTMNAVIARLEKKKTVISAKIDRMMSYELTQVLMPVAKPSGAMRFAETSDMELLTDWAVKFICECDAITSRAPDLRDDMRKKTTHHISSKSRVVWEVDGKPVSMAGTVRSADFGTSVAWVYTPVEFRGRGYASQLVAEFSQHLLDHGSPRCLLFTDSTNPTSNAIYQRIGYRHACDYLLLKNMPDFL